MSGNKYLLDTNFILGILKSDPLVLAQVSSRQRQLHVGEWEC
jgi:predicted nucleic acid-binding protein